MWKGTFRRIALLRTTPNSASGKWNSHRYERYTTGPEAQSKPRLRTARMRASPAIPEQMEIDGHSCSDSAAPNNSAAKPAHATSAAPSPAERRRKGRLGVAKL